MANLRRLALPPRRPATAMGAHADTVIGGPPPAPWPAGVATDRNERPIPGNAGSNLYVRMG